MFGESYVKMHLAQRECVHALLQDMEMQIAAYTARMNKARNAKVSKADSKYRYTLIPKMTIRSDRFNPVELPEYSSKDLAPRVRWYQYDSVRRAGVNKVAKEVPTNKTGYTINTFMKYAPVEIAKLAYETEQILKERRGVISDLYLFKRVKRRVFSIPSLKEELEEAYAQASIHTEN
ncbi:hypothetical protein [Alteromonas gracilis]|uniref:hypothetical protein n=1 Tax=Alteromonas gracilis TaxID=1479524 RepID=UPI0037355159